MLQISLRSKVVNKNRRNFVCAKNDLTLNFEFQVSVFSNMPSYLSRDDWVHSIIEIVEISLRDERVEVREKAGQVLSGLFHCEFIRGERRTKLLVS